MKKFQYLVLTTAIIVQFSFLKELILLLNLSDSGIAILKILMITLYIGVLHKINPELLKNAFTGKPKNLVLYAALIPSLLIYASGFDFVNITNNISKDYAEGLFQLQRILLNATIEEILFRVFAFYMIWNFFQNDRRFVIRALLIASLVFGLCHLKNQEELGLHTASLQSYGAFCLGFLFGVIYLKTNNITLVAIAHCFINYSAQFSFLAEATIAPKVSEGPNTVSLVITVAVYSIPLIIGFLIVKYYKPKTYYLYA